MKDRFEFFGKLPAMLKGSISGVLPTAEASGLSSSSREMNFLSRRPPAVPMTLRKFLHLAVRGEHTQMQHMLRENIDLLWQRGIVTDYSGREFGAISGFEYALWALDKHQWDDMLACLPREKTGHLTAKGREIVEELQRQYVQVKTKGVTYRLNEMTETESHYDFSIINALQEQVNAQNAPGDKNWDAIDKHWCQFVGGVQRLLPVHVVDEYCSKTPFSLAVPQFTTRPKPANGLRQFYNHLSGVWESWFGGHSKLGVDFAIFKGAASAAWTSERACDGGDDLAAMTALCKARTFGFSALEVQLKSLLVVEEQPLPSPGI